MAGYLLLAFYKRSSKTLLVWSVSLMAVFLLLPFIALTFLAAAPNDGEDGAEDSVLGSYGMDLSYLQSIGER